MNISCDIVPYAINAIMYMLGSPLAHSQVNALPHRHTWPSSFRSSSPLYLCPFTFHTVLAFLQQLQWKVLLAVVLTCLKLSPGIPESTSILGQCTLVCCYSSALPCQNRRGDNVQLNGRRHCCDLCCAFVHLTLMLEPLLEPGTCLTGSGS